MTSPRALSATGAREGLLKAARALFYRDGIAATGIDAIIKRAGVAIKSLYHHLDARAALVAVYLEAHHAELPAGPGGNSRCVRQAHDMAQTRMATP